MVVIGVVLVRNEDLFLEYAVRNAAAFCDRIFAFDHMSTDETPNVLAHLARELDHLTVTRTRDARESHRAVEPYAGSDAWVLGIDGDELYDPAALARLRSLLEGGAYADAFHVKGHVLNCTRLDRDAMTATGHMAPPSRPVTKLFNLRAVETWSGCPERLHAGHPLFRPGFDWSSLRYASEETEWSTDPLRMLHVCFLQRSSEEDLTSVATRRNLSESGAFHRSAARPRRQAPLSASHRPPHQGVPSEGLDVEARVVRARAGRLRGRPPVPRDAGRGRSVMTGADPVPGETPGSII